MTRRELLGALALAGAAACAPREAAVARATPAPLKILILGGTTYVGPQLVEVARRRGHTVTLFNRGRTHTELFPDVEKLRGDRDGKLDALKGRRWDAVIDTSGYVPRIVKMSAELLAPSVGMYVFVSTISVYASLTERGADETAPVQTVSDPTTEDSKTYYGALKALCEQAAEAAMPGRTLSVRPGLIIGPGDPTGRFTHWPSRLRHGGDVLAPGDGTTPVQWIDVRDVAEFIVHAIETRAMGVMNLLGPSPGEPMRDVLAAVNRAAGGRAKLVWVPGDFLDAHGVHGWSDLPMWIDAKGEDAGFGTRSNKCAVAAGLTQRPIEETAGDTLIWLDAQPAEQRVKLASSGVSKEKEAEILAAWRAKA